MNFIHRHPTLMIAHNAYLDARHNKVLHIAGLFAAVLILFSLFLGEISLFQNEKIVKDIGLSSISLLGVFIAIYLGVNSLYQDLQKRTIYTIMAKPIGRREVLIGKYLGMAFVLVAVVLMMTTYLYLVTAFLEGSIDWGLLPAIGLLTIELLVVAAIAVFFSSFSSPFLSAFFSAGLFLIGRVSRELADFGERSKNLVFKYFATGVQKVYDLDSFDLRTEVVHKLPIYAQDFWYPALYGFLMILFFVLISNELFARRDFK